jgi:8-oxo-dGTP pyrophosphatase MutT (NUDIX family)
MKPLPPADHEPNWQTESVDTVYDNPWITVTHRNVIAPTGKPGIYGKVHFKNLALGVVPIDADGNTYLVGQHRYTLNEYAWEIPEGGGSRSVEPLETAKRELREETGIEAARWTPLLKMHTSNSVTDEVAYTFVAQELSYGDNHWDDTEQLQVVKLPLEEAVARVMNGEITDSLAMASLLKVQRMIDLGELRI